MNEEQLEELDDLILTYKALLISFKEELSPQARSRMQDILYRLQQKYMQGKEES